MAKDREMFTWNGIGAQIPDAGIMLDAQRAAAGTAARVASGACHYAMSVNKAWLSFWSNHLTQYTEIPKRLADAQSDFMQKAFEHYQESVEQLSGLAKKAEEEVREVIRETGEAGERAYQQFQTEARDMARASQPKESRPARAAEREAEHQHGAH